jgi:hypothetical protein
LSLPDLIGQSRNWLSILPLAHPVKPDDDLEKMPDDDIEKPPYDAPRAGGRPLNRMMTS